MPVRSTSPAPGHRVGLRVLIVLVSILMGLALGEGFLRMRVWRANSETLARSFSRLGEPSLDPNAGLMNVIRLSKNERLIYELQPELEGRTFRESLVSTDERGFRVSPQVPDDERPLFTIVGLGDSIMFGHGVNDGETFLYRLQELLQVAHPERRFRVVNTGVPGYNTVMEVETLREKCLDLEPDLVILNLVSNDYAPPYFVRNEVDPWAMDHSFLLDLVRERAREEGDDEEERWRAAGGGVLGDGRALYERDGSNKVSVPEAYSQVFGRQAFALALEELVALSHEHGFELLCFTTYEWDKIVPMLEQVREHGIPHSTLMPELREKIREESGVAFSEKSYVRSSLVVSPANKHPSAMQHEMAAQRLLVDLERLGLVGRD